MLCIEPIASEYGHWMRWRWCVVCVAQHNESRRMRDKWYVRHFPYNKLVRKAAISGSMEMHWRGSGCDSSSFVIDVWSTFYENRDEIMKMPGEKWGNSPTKWKTSSKGTGGDPVNVSTVGGRRNMKEILNITSKNAKIREKRLQKKKNLHWLQLKTRRRDCNRATTNTKNVIFRFLPKS